MWRRLGGVRIRIIAAMLSPVKMLQLVFFQWFGRIHGHRTSIIWIASG